LGYTSSPSGRGNANHWEKSLARLAVAGIVLHLTAVGQEKVDAFGAVQRTTTAQADNGINLQRRGKVSSGLDHSAVRVHLEIVKSENFNRRLAQGSQGFIDVAGGNETPIGYQQSALEAEFTCYLAEPFNSAGSEDYASTRLEIEGVHKTESVVQSTTFRLRGYGSGKLKLVLRTA